MLDTTLSKIAKNNQIKLLFIFNTKDQNNLANRLKLDTNTFNDLLNKYLKTVSVPSVSLEQDVLNFGNLKVNIPLYKYNFDTINCVFYFHPKIANFFLTWFNLQFDNDGIPLISSAIDPFYVHVELQLLNTSTKILLKRTFISNLQFVNTLYVNSPVFLEISVTLVPNYILISN